jgi:uncharacterized protein
MNRNETRFFPVGIAEDLQSYVYLYVDPRNDEIFYVGKGEGDRVFSHLVEAQKTEKKSEKLNRIRDIWNSGNDVILRLHRHGLTSAEAFHVEASLIELFPDATNEVEGYQSISFGDRLVSDVINEKQRLQANIDFPAVLINIRKEWLRIRPRASRAVDAGQLLESTRTAWDIQPSRHKTVKHAISVAFGLVREVYNIREWLPATVNADGTLRPEDGRWMFKGDVASDKRHLVGTAIDHLQKPGAQNPIKWLDRN